ncbi:MAG: RDD family protein [Agriterribacter sp.]
MNSSIYNRPISVGTRIGTMLLDHFFMTLIMMLFFIPAMVQMFSVAFTVSHEQVDINFMQGPTKYIAVFGFALYFCKDIFNGRSIAKRILHLQVIDNTTGEAASPIQCFIRDIFCALWPIEVIIAIVHTNRRLGDRIAGTRLVHYNPTTVQPAINIGKILVPIAISYTLVLLLLQTFPSIKTTKTAFSPSSYNHAESKRMEQLITDSLGKYLTPDIRIYDTVKNEPVKYVSIILRLKENYLDEDKNAYDQLHEMTTNLVYSIIPKEKLTGSIQYVYKGDGQFQSVSSPIGGTRSTRNKP